MRIAEIILGIGGGIGGWLIFISLALVVAVLRQADCDPSSDELWLGTLVLAVLGGGGVLLMGLGMTWRASLRWFSLLAVPLAAYAVLGVLPALADTTLAGGALCGICGTLPEGAVLSDFPATGLQRAWPVVQVLVLALGIAQSLRYWRGANAQA